MATVSSIPRKMKDYYGFDPSRAQLAIDLTAWNPEEQAVTCMGTTTTANSSGQCCARRLDKSRVNNTVKDVETYLKMDRITDPIITGQVPKWAEDLTCHDHHGLVARVKVRAGIRAFKGKASGKYVSSKYDCYGEDLNEVEEVMDRFDDERDQLMERMRRLELELKANRKMKKMLTEARDDSLPAY